MNILELLNDYYFYARNFQKIKTKLHGLQPLELRVYQKSFIDFVDRIQGPKRVIALKPRQAGFSTIVASYFSHKMCTIPSYRHIALADKKGRTLEIAGMYRTFVEELEDGIKPLIALNNTEQILLDNPSDKSDEQGMGSSVRFETGQDPNAGRSGTRQSAHISEAAFIRYMKQIDDGIQNSIPLDDSTTIIKESTANGKAGVGKPFYDLWQAAKRGESIYKPFFVAWYEIDDYQLAPPRGFAVTPHEKDILRQHPSVTEANLAWRRLKLLEYLNDDELSIASPEERFKQDFPLNDEEAFLNTGAPVFDPEMVNNLNKRLNDSPVPEVKDRLKLNSFILKDHWNGLKIYSPPRQNKTYFIGADISEGLAIGDASSAYIMDESYNQVARWHGKIDPDVFGHLLICLGELFNNALIVPEKNNMGLTTVLVIRNEGYPRLYREMIEDKGTKEFKERLGWVTTKKSKMVMLNEFITKLRDGDSNIRDIRLVEEMSLVSREENGTVNLNGRDRVVAACLAHMGRKQSYISDNTKLPEPSKELYDKDLYKSLAPKVKKNTDIFG